MVQQDPGLTAGLLKLCNSPLYGFKRRIGSPAEALVLVGNLTFARLCFTLSLEPVLHRDLPGYNLDLDTLWQHSLATAYGASFLMKMAGLRAEQDRAFTAGLLHDIGKLVLDVAVAAPDVNQGRVVMTPDREVAATGFDHAQAGAALMESWNLPDQIITAVRFHHAPGDAPAGNKLPAAIHVADKVAHVAGRLRAGSKAMAAWVENACGQDPFAPDHIGNLAGTVSSVG